jgi:hypothetical protein
MECWPAVSEIALRMAGTVALNDDVASRADV